MFFYLIYNSSIIKKDNNKNVNTLIYGSIVYIVLHALIYANNSLRSSILRYFWIILSIDIVSIFMSTEISSDLQKHNLAQDAKYLLKKKKKRREINIDKDQKSNHKDSKSNHKDSKSNHKDLKSKVEEFINYEKPIKERSTEIKNLPQRKSKNQDIIETQNILNQIEEDSLAITEELGQEEKIERIVQKKIDQSKKVSFKEELDDSKSELSDGSDLELDLESFEKSLLED